MDTPVLLGSNNVPVSGGCMRFSRSKWPARASNDRRVEPPGPDSVATTTTKALLLKNEIKQDFDEDTIVMLREECYRIICLEYMPPS